MADEPMVVVASRVKQIVKDQDLRADGQLADAVNEHVICMIKEAAKRAKANKRGTIRPHDL